MPNKSNIRPTIIAGLRSDIPEDLPPYPGTPLPRRVSAQDQALIEGTGTSVRLENVSKTYKMGEELFWALRNVTFEIEKGEFVSILGPSGSGKSTLMHLIGGLDKPTNGEVYIGENNLSKLNGRRLATLRNKQIGFVFQFFNLLPRTTVLDNVMLPLIYSTNTKDRKSKALQIIERVGLKQKVKHKSNELSGGEQQRVAIARALVNDPEIILADEPTSNLDSKTGIQILELLVAFSRLGKTLIIVTHDQNIAKNSTRIIKLQDGQFV